MQTATQRRNATAGGFSLIELMVAISIFSIVVLVAVSTLLAMIDANRRAQGIKTAMNNAFFSMESITRAIRTGHTYRCTTNQNDTGTTPFDCSSGGTVLRFINDQDDWVRIRFDGARVWQQVDGGTELPLMAEDLTIENFRFFVTGASTARQPTVTLRLIGIANENNPRLRTQVELQTTVTQRLRDLQ